MRRFKITVAYDGTGLVGWQRQAAGTSIQGLLEHALGQLDERDVTVIGAGRTDAGVHALGQVASFSLAREIAPGAVVRALNARLPDSVRVLTAIEVPTAFHARFGARAKTYRYRLWNSEVLSPFEHQYAWHLVGAIDVAEMAAAARIVEGRHDFAAFQAAGAATRTTERELFSSRIDRVSMRSAAGGGEDAEETAFLRTGFDLRPPPADGGAFRRGDLLIYEVRGSGFLRHMVRNIVGTLVEIGRGRHPAAWMGEVLASCNRTQAGPTAPAAGLFLVSVEYEAPPAVERVNPADASPPAI